ncbi:MULTISPECIES: LysR family transcriptional regulator [Gordonia]|uniref:Putative LysR family transcriptional regulator n=1 Tax=Gordonia sputi NBRC 100414 TaxID=1089453 RepID=H5TYB8_9ACTN|nr:MULTISPECIES: LysR family transcriptional regulator [Gordonia]MCM3894781.1 LysR family transcriptional regulator [Gordonia sputi]NKY92719.1 LysR family transcriptional regulator [Gordonia sputi]OBA63578.1 LysR family transcriptional regulator [Gordonia sp. 852002-10350_SCH5691597]GAB38476.1 putative LysR family transcriptional regulator [Gordonia sputi NBRC 100414]
MELRQIEYFLAVVEHGGIGGASVSLGVTQPTVSQALRALERELGVQLFHRIGRGMVPSAAGRALVGSARQIVRDVGSVDDALAVGSDQITGRVEILASPFADGSTIADVVAAFVSAHPTATIRVGELDDESLAAAVIEEGRCDFVVTHLHPVETAVDDALEVIVLGEQEFWLVCPSGTVLPDGPIDIADLPHIPMVFVPRGGTVADEIESAMREAGVRPPIAVLAEDREERLPMVLAGIGATLLERRVAESVADRTTVRPVRPRFVRNFALMYDPTALSIAAQAFVDVVRTLHREN